MSRDHWHHICNIQKVNEPKLFFKMCLFREYINYCPLFFVRTTRSDEEPSLEKDVLQSGRSLEAALYVLYGSATMIVVSLGDGVHGFTYDPRVGTKSHNCFVTIASSIFYNHVKY